MSKIYVSRTGVAEEAKVYLPFGDEVRELQKAYRGNAQGIAELIWEKQSGGPFELISYSGTMELVEYETGKWYARLLSDGELVTNGGVADVFMAGRGGDGGTGVSGTVGSNSVRGGGGSGGGGGYTATFRRAQIPETVNVTVVSGATLGSMSVANGTRGGNGISSTTSAGGSNPGGNGGSGGGSGSTGQSTNGGSNGADGSSGSASRGGVGQHTTTRAFEGDIPPFDASGDWLFAGGGGGGQPESWGHGGDGGGGTGSAGGAQGTPGTANTGGGGGGGGGHNRYSSAGSRAGFAGGSGIVTIRWGNW